MEDWRRICTPAKAALEGFAYRYEHATNHGQCVKSPLAANDMAKTCEPNNAENLSKLCYKLRVIRCQTKALKPDKSLSSKGVAAIAAVRDRPRLACDQRS